MTSLPTIPLTRRVAWLAVDIKLSHSVFALPFAVLAMFLAADDAGRRPTVGEAVLIVLCMVLARTVAMCINRWADARIDASNPRTMNRAVPSGRLSRRFVLAAAGLAAGIFVAATSLFLAFHDNPWPLLLSPAVLAWVCVYSFTKRFTWLCHVVLGSALALSPVAAAIAIEPGYLAQPTIWLLAGMVLCWVAGFDVIYALQDVAVDQRDGLHSMPAKLGVEPALWISRLLHVLCMACLFATWWLSPLLGTSFAVAAVVTAGLLLLEHGLVWRSRTRHIHMAFFTVNGIISLLLGLAGVADVLMR